MHPLYILKLGGSIVTHKNRAGASIRKKLVREIAKNLRLVLREKKIDLILLHGAGSAGHQLAHKYNLREGVNGKKERWNGAFLSRLTNQRLNWEITNLLTKAGLRITPIHTASIITQKNGKISRCYLETIQEALKQNCLPLLYGEMVFDQTSGMTICSGDAIAPYLAKKLQAEKIFFASDIDGVFTADPHVKKNATLIENVFLADINQRAALSASHNVDVTDGLLGKIKNLLISHSSKLQTVEIFNGLKAGNFLKILRSQNFPHTTIYLKKNGK